MFAKALDGVVVVSHTPAGMVAGRVAPAIFTELVHGEVREERVIRHKTRPMQLLVHIR